MTGQSVFRPEPALPARLMKTYELTAPPATHRRPATCTEVDCPQHTNGWVSTFDPSTSQGQAQLRYVRLHSGRSFTDTTAPGAPLVELTFPAGQRCFQAHTVSLEREPFVVVRDGDWRGNPTRRERRHVHLADWVDDFATHQQGVADAREKG